MKYLKKLDIKLVRGKYKNPIKTKLKYPKQIFTVFESIKNHAHETLIGVYMDDKLNIIVYDVICTGTSSTGVIAPHEMFGHMFAVKAKSFILIHNHPKGDPSPSEADKELIDRLKRQSMVMKVDFLDFMIVGDIVMNKKKIKYWSMFEESGHSKYFHNFYFTDD